MTTLLIILILLTAPLLFGVTLSRIAGTRVRRSEFLGCIGIALVFGFSALGHFVETQGMAAMLPPFVPGRIPLVYATGVLELLAAVCVLIPRLRTVTGVALIVMLLLFLPVNVYAAMNRTGLGGHQWGPVYLLIRVPLQVILIVWIWWFAVRSSNRGAAAVVSQPS